MNYTVWSYLIYLSLSVPVALFVGWTLHRNGRTFLMEVFQRREDLADSVNHLLVVGYYLLSIGFWCRLRSGTASPRIMWAGL